MSVDLHGKQALEDTVNIDTKVYEKNIKRESNAEGGLQLTRKVRFSGQLDNR